MSAPRQVAWQDRPAQPWRNGGGVTRELMAWPAGDDWRVRVSVADIDRDGPFSALPGVARWFAVLSGAGVELGLPTGALQVRHGDAPCAFDGAHAPSCRLLEGSTRDLNLMLRHSRGGMYRAEVGVPWQPTGGQCGLFSALAGHVLVDHGDGRNEDIALPAMSLSWWASAPAGLVFQAGPGQGEPALAGHTHGWWMAAFDPAG